MRRVGSSSAAVTAAIASAALQAAWADMARADGAFPDSQNVLLPLEELDRIILATNFGLVVTEDGGEHWRYSCESQATANGRLYSLGPGPDHRIFSVSDFGAAVSADLGCTWRLGGGPFDGGQVFDVFPHPADPARVLAVARPPATAGPAPTSVFESQDGGLTYSRLLFPGPAAGGISGVEIARGDPLTMYVTLFEMAATDTSPHPRLARTADGGQTWQTVDLEPMLGASRVAIAAVDPTLPQRLFLRVGGTNEQMRSVDSLAVSSDGGSTFNTPVSLTGGTLTAFLVRTNGTVLVSGLLGATVVGYRSRDGGATFASWRSGLHPRGFAERGGTLFVAADDTTDGFALASSEDDGDTWAPRLRFGDIEAIRACVAGECVVDCTKQARLAIFPLAVCGPAATSPSDRDGGAGTAGGGCSSCAAGGGERGERAAAATAPPLGRWMILLLVTACLTAITGIRGRRRSR